MAETDFEVVMSNIQLLTKPSTIPRAGEGLFAGDFIPAGQVVVLSFYRRSYGIGTHFEDLYDQTYENSKINHSLTPNLVSFWDGSARMYKRINPNFQTSFTSNFPLQTSIFIFTPHF